MDRSLTRAMAEQGVDFHRLACSGVSGNGSSAIPSRLRLSPRQASGDGFRPPRHGRAGLLWNEKLKPEYLQCQGRLSGTAGKERARPTGSFPLQPQAGRWKRERAGRPRKSSTRKLGARRLCPLSGPLTGDFVEKARQLDHIASSPDAKIRKLVEVRPRPTCCVDKRPRLQAPLRDTGGLFETYNCLT